MHTRLSAFRLIIALVMACLHCAGTSAVAATANSQAATFDRHIADAKGAMVRDPIEALNNARAAEVDASHLDGSDRAIAVATALWLQGEAYLRMNNPVAAGPRIDRALVLIRNVRPLTKLNGDLLMSAGGLNTMKADVAAALESYQDAYRIFQAIGETRSRAIALVNIGVLYQEAADYETALKKYGQSLEIYSADPLLLLSIYGNRGVSFQGLNRLDEAQVEFRKAITIARSVKSPAVQALNIRNMARSQLMAGKVDAADETIATGLRITRGSAAAAARNRFVALSAWSALQRVHLVRARGLIEQFFRDVDPETSALELREGHQIAYDIYKKLNDQATALRHLEALKTSDDKTSKLAASANTALAAAGFDFANQELKIEKLKRAQLQRNVEDARQRADTQQMIFAGLAAATLVIVALLAFGLVTIRRSRDEVRAANDDLAKTNGALGKALAAKTEFLATTSHEIRTPLNGILGMTQVMLADTTLTEPIRDRIGVVHGAGVTMRALVDDILDVAKMETGNLTIEHAPFDLRATLRDVSRLWEEQARGKGVSFTLDLADCPSHVKGDAARLRQIVFNLLSNALKFTEAGGVTVRARQGGTATQPTLEVSVADTGIGIAPDKRGLIFESFRQADAGTTRKYGGTGLGLAICRNLARAMDGDVTVSGVPGEGSTFTLRLPLALAAVPDAVVATGHAVPRALLIVDRNPISRAMLRAVLEPRAGSVVFASSADEALACVAQGGIATVLVDDATIKAAPDLDAALCAMAQAGPPVALLWPAPAPADDARFRALGVDLVVAKPIAGAALAAALFDRSGCDDSATRHLVMHAA